MKKIILVLSVLSLLSMHALGQDVDQGSKKKTEKSLHIVGGYIFQDRTETSKVGIEGQLAFPLNSNFGIQLKGGMLKWPRMDLLTFPLLLGPEYSIDVFNNSRITFYAQAGPSLSVGNDYAGIFGSVETGIQTKVNRDRGIVIHFAWGQNLAFHPSHFSFVKAGVGWRF